MGFTGTTVEHCKALLEQLDAAVAVANEAEYKDAVAGLKNLQYLFCQSLARENMWERKLQEAMKLGDAAFFRVMIPEIEEANTKGQKNFDEVFGE